LTIKQIIYYSQPHIQNIGRHKRIALHKSQYGTVSKDGEDRGGDIRCGL